MSHGTRQPEEPLLEAKGGSNVCLGDPFDADRCGVDQARRAMVARFGVAHEDVMAVNHVADQLLGGVDAKMRALFVLAGEKFAVAVTVRYEHNTRFLAFLHHVGDG